jgi:hypothetical protein
VHTPNPACCIGGGDCNDGDPCTIDACLGNGSCSNADHRGLLPDGRRLRRRQRLHVGYVLADDPHLHACHRRGLLHRRSGLRRQRRLHGGQLRPDHAHLQEPTADRLLQRRGGLR